MPLRRDLLQRLAAGVAASAAVALGALAWGSTLLGEYSVMDMGGHAAHAGGTGDSGTKSPAGSISVAELAEDPLLPADVRVELVARQEAVEVPGGRPIQGYTVNGTSPGPTVRARQGDLVEVVFVNESVTAGATLHWHGIDVPNAADGVAGVTQDAVPVGNRHVYRFRAADAGTYWYHSHQLSHEQVEGGLFGAVVIDPFKPPVAPVITPAAVDVVALLHIYGGQHTLNGRLEDQNVAAEPRSTVRVRVINTDQGTAAVWSASPFRVLATDGHDVNAPAAVGDSSVLIPAGGRIDVSVEAPAQGAARLHVGGARSITVGDVTAPPPAVPQPPGTLDLLAYGTPARPAFDPRSPDRSFEYVIGRRLGLIDGRPGNFWTINGQMFPDVPMFRVQEGDIVAMRIVNETGEVHPMHLHGHHVLVLSRNGEAASGSPWWVDSLDVHPSEAYEVAFIADNPGIWTDHCHTLPHAVDGLVAHLMYEGVSTPFTINGPDGNQPE